MAFAATRGASTAAGQDPTGEPAAVRIYPNVAAMRNDAELEAGAVACTLGYHQAGDQGDAVYRIVAADPKQTADGGALIATAGGQHASLQPSGSVNYYMFGVKADGDSDDGVQIKQAHAFASRHRLPIVQPGGEFWIKNTHEILITTNVQWGNTIFHLDEKFNEKRKPRFVIKGLQPSQTIELDAQAKKSFLEKLKPGVSLISELAPYKNCLVTVVDANDRIGFRSGARYKGQSWAREELFYVEEEGRILGDIAWTFSDYTALRAYPCEDTYVVVEGGGFYLSGDNPGERYTGYYQNGFSIQRSRTILRNQWVGLEPGKRDVSMEPRSGFYSFRHVFDATLENVRLIPWEQNRSDPAKKVGAGTYGIGGARMLNCTFRNVTAEGSWLHWGVFGTNLNKNFRIENCRLNRVDVHFHCWNLTIQDSEIGLRGISITGGGDLLIENTTAHGNTLVNFRRDFGAKWDGDIRIRNCRLIPPRDREVVVLSSNPAKFDYGYAIGCGRTIDIENLRVDFRHFPDSTAAIWLLRIAPYSKTEDQTRLFFPHHFAARNVTVLGRQQGVRLVSIADPYHYDLGRQGGYDGTRLTPNCQMVFENIMLEALPASQPDDPAHAHLRLGKSAESAYEDGLALYPQLRIINCPNLCLHLGGSAVNATISDCSIDRLSAASGGPLRGKLVIDGCSLAPRISDTPGPIYALEAALGTHLNQCTVHAPHIAGASKPERADQLDFIQINKQVRYHQSGTSLGNDLLEHLRSQKIELLPGFIAMLKSHHQLESETVPAAGS